MRNLSKRLSGKPKSIWFFQAGTNATRIVGARKPGVKKLESACCRPSRYLILSKSRCNRIAPGDSNSFAPFPSNAVALSNLDRELLDKCLAKDTAAWQEFTDRFLALIVHVVNHTAASRNIQITTESRDDLVAEVFLSWIEKDFAALRRFRGRSSLATYLTVIARRVIVRRLSQLRIPNSHTSLLFDVPGSAPAPHLHNSLDFQSALAKLSPNEATALKMFHLEGCTYQEIGSRIGMPENSVGPLLSRARDKMKSLV